MPYTDFDKIPHRWSEFLFKFFYQNAKTKQAYYCKKERTCALYKKAFFFFFFNPWKM